MYTVLRFYSDIDSVPDLRRNLQELSLHEKATMATYMRIDHRMNKKFCYPKLMHALLKSEIFH